MDIGLLKTLTLLILIRQTVNPISETGNDYTDMSDIQRKCVANPVADSYHEPDADIKNDVAVLDIQLDSTNEQESDGSELILERKVGKNLLDLRPVEILEKVFLDAMKLSDFSFPVMSAGYSTTLLQQFLSWKDSNKEP